jgi:hypothetical protein
MKTLLLLPLIALSLFAGACIFGDESDPDPQPVATSAPARPAISRNAAEATATPRSGRTTFPEAPRPARAPVDGEISVVYSFPFIWPADGPITSFMSPEHPNGIDIGLEDSETLDIRAAARGIVSEADGSEEDPLGISIVIDHGNGVTTVYGHLSEVLVEPGDEVEIGQVIAIGGSTGLSSGAHLHLEVRKDGETVDPLHVLPVEEGDTVALNVDCLAGPITLPAGAQALFDFGPVLNDGESIATAEAVALSGAPSIEATVAGSTEVLVASPINFHGPDGLDTYYLEVTLDTSLDNNVLNCGIAVQQREVPTTFYVRTFTPTDDTGDDGSETGEVAAQEEQPPPEPTPTPNPWAQTPNYQVPAAASSGVETPNYSGAAGSSAGGVQSPSYGIFAPTATPAAGETATPATGE